MVGLCVICGRTRPIFRLLVTLTRRTACTGADNKPHDGVVFPLHEEKVTMNCDITSTFILYPYFSEEATVAGLQTCMVTSARYIEMLSNFTIPNFLHRNSLYDLGRGELRWRSPTCEVLCQTFLNTTAWWHSYPPPFHVSVAANILRSHSNGFLGAGISEIQCVCI